MYTKEERDRLILEHHGYAVGLARKMRSELPPVLDVDDLVGVAVLALFDTVDRFDPALGVPFRAYARTRIRGAILDAVRAADWVPTSVRRKATKVERAKERLAERLGRAPRRAELADELELHVTEFDALVTGSEIRPLLSLDAPVGEDDKSMLSERVSLDDTMTDDALIVTEQLGAVREAVSKLPPRERKAVELHHYRGWKLHEVGRALGVTESRACQLCKQGAARLRKQLQAA